MRLFLIFCILALVAISHGETTEAEKHETTAEQSPPTNASVMPILDATASKLVRYRSKPPPNHYRIKPQPHKRPRPRVKMPPIKYGPPMFGPHKPNNYHIKPDSFTSTQLYKPSYSYDEVQYEVSSDYPVLENIANYETQTIDLDLYGDSYSKKKPPRYEYSKPRKPFNIPRPHKIYGAPKETSYTSYETYHPPKFSSKPDVHYEVSYHEEPPKQSYGPPRSHKEVYEQFPPYGQPPQQISYHVPDKYERPVDSYHPPGPPPKEISYPTYNKKLPNVGYSYNNHFAEPPTDFHFSYSPSHEIKPAPPHQHHSQNKNEGHPHESYEPPNDGYHPPVELHESVGDSYSAPDYNQYSHSEYQPPIGGHFAEPPGSYLPPAHHQDDLPLSNTHMPPGYDYPKSSYEVPIYDPIPFESTTPEQDFFPPNHHTHSSHHEHASESNNHIQRAPPHSRPSLSPADTTTNTTIDYKPTQDAKNKVLRRYTPYKNRTNRITRPTSASKLTPTTEEAEVPSPKNLEEVLSTTASTFRPRRKRKRTKAPVTEKHNLDTPELKEAYESGLHIEPVEPTAHESNVNENIDKGSHSIPKTYRVRPLTNFTPSQSWNPIRTRTRMPNIQRGQRVAEDAFNELKDIEVVSIEKSRSHSYYAGTVSPRTRDSITRSDTSKPLMMSSTTLKTKEVVQPTKNLVIDTTYFKVKEDQKDYYDGTGELPKNHKLF